jgi:hypothetical protein
LPAATASVLDLSESDSSLLSDGVTVVMWDRGETTPKSTGDLIVVRHQTSAEPVFSNRRLASRAHLYQLFVENWTSESDLMSVKR